MHVKVLHVLETQCIALDVPMNNPKLPVVLDYVASTVLNFCSFVSY